MVNSRSKLIGWVIAVVVIVGVSAGVGFYFVRQAPSQVQIRVAEVRFSYDDGSDGAPVDDSVVGRLARAVRSEVIVDTFIEVESDLPVSATIQNVSWTVVVGGVNVGSGTTPPGVEQTVAADGTSVIEAQTRVPVSKIASVMLNAQGPTVDVAGTAEIRVLGVSVVREFEADAVRIVQGGTLNDLLSR